MHGATEIAPLSSATTEAGERAAGFEAGRARFVFDAATLSFRPLRYPDTHPFGAYRSSRGLAPGDAAAALAAYGPNATPVPVPAFGQLLKQQLVAPFFVFQVFCVGLWCLDEYWWEGGGGGGGWRGASRGGRAADPVPPSPSPQVLLRLHPAHARRL